MNDLVDIRNKPNEALIGLLKALLEEAESGDLHSMTCVCQYAGGVVNNSWSLDQERVHRFGLLGAMRMSEHDYLQWIQLNEPESILRKYLREQGVDP